ncbi:MAG: hypothetical protein M1831_001376 [Alyxoria varia]|nr:MAG: hypothetical protein M1831_001376 [Alyxoria varia]
MSTLASDGAVRPTNDAQKSTCLSKSATTRNEDGFLCRPPSSGDPLDAGFIYTPAQKPKMYFGLDRSKARAIQSRAEAVDRSHHGKDIHGATTPDLGTASSTPDAPSVKHTNTSATQDSQAITRIPDHVSDIPSDNVKTLEGKSSVSADSGKPRKVADNNHVKQTKKQRSTEESSQVVEKSNPQQHDLEPVPSHAGRQPCYTTSLMSSRSTSFGAHESETNYDDIRVDSFQNGCSNDSNVVSSHEPDEKEVSPSLDSSRPRHVAVEQTTYITPDSTPCPEQHTNKAKAADRSTDPSTNKEPMEDCGQRSPAAQSTMDELKAILNHLLAQKWPDLSHIEDCGKLKQHLQLYENYRQGLEQLLVSMATSVSNQLDQLGIDLEAAQRSLANEMTVNKKLQLEFDAFSPHCDMRREQTGEALSALRKKNKRNAQEIYDLTQRIGDATRSLEIEKADTQHLHKELGDKCGLLGEARTRIASLEEEVKKFWTEGLQRFEKRLGGMESNLTNRMQQNDQDIRSSFTEGKSQIEAVTNSIAHLHKSVDSKGDTQSISDSIGAIMECYESKYRAYLDKMGTKINDTSATVTATGIQSNQRIDELQAYFEARDSNALSRYEKALSDLENRLMSNKQDLVKVSQQCEDAIDRERAANDAKAELQKEVDGLLRRSLEDKTWMMMQPTIEQINKLEEENASLQDACMAIQEKWNASEEDRQWLLSERNTLQAQEERDKANDAAREAADNDKAQLEAKFKDEMNQEVQAKAKLLHEKQELTEKIAELEEKLQRSNDELTKLQETHIASQSKGPGRVTSTVSKRKVDRRTNAIIYAQHEFEFGDHVFAYVAENEHDDIGTYHWPDELENRPRPEIAMAGSVAADRILSRNDESILSFDEEPIQRSTLGLQVLERREIEYPVTSPSTSAYQTHDTLPWSHDTPTTSPQRNNSPTGENVEPEVESAQLQVSDSQQPSAFRLQESSTGQAPPAIPSTSPGISLTNSQLMHIDQDWSFKNLATTQGQVQSVEQEDLPHLQDIRSPDRISAQPTTADHSSGAPESVEGQVEPAQQQALSNTRIVQDPNSAIDKRKHAIFAEQSGEVTLPKPKKRATNSRNVSVAPTALPKRIQPEREASKQSRIKSRLALGGNSQKCEDSKHKAQASKGKSNSKGQPTKTTATAANGRQRKAISTSESLSFVQSALSSHCVEAAASANVDKSDGALAHPTSLNV